ncbi:hypothetical protein J6590_031534 [Homalodisca vitripennis]|nr:hypothetical protein J6590_031534 [Homalodisca vitripennis]
MFDELKGCLDFAFKRSQVVDEEVHLYRDGVTQPMKSCDRFRLQIICLVVPVCRDKYTWYPQVDLCKKSRADGDSIHELSFRVKRSSAKLKHSSSRQRSSCLSHQFVSGTLRYLLPILVPTSLTNLSKSIPALLYDGCNTASRSQRRTQE